MVEILMATYNGEKYIREQLDSILNQTYKDIRILIRDDGSKDRTIDIIKEYIEKYRYKIRLIEDDVKCGSSVSNFMQLTKSATADYVMYSDQDDFWLPKKVEKTLQAMIDLEEKIGKDKPALSFARHKPVDLKLQPIQEDVSKTQLSKCETEFNKLLVQNCVNGCLMMVNKPLYSILGNYNKDILMHDWWAALIAGAMGGICRIPDVLMLYRQHGDNVVGSVNVKSFKYRISKMLDKNTRNMKFRYRDQAKLFYQRYSSMMPDASRQILEDFLKMYEEKSKFKRIRALISGGYLKSDTIRRIGQIWYI